MGTSSTTSTPDPAQAAYLEAYLDKALDERLAQRQSVGLSDELFSQVRAQISKELGATLEAFVQRNELRSREFSLLERMVRVEEELKALRETEAVHFAAMKDRFESVDKRFTVVMWAIGIGFTTTCGLLAAMVARLG